MENTLALIAPSVRLIVVQFLIKMNLVPSIIPKRENQSSSSSNKLSGIEVLSSRPNVYLKSLAEFLTLDRTYRLVDCWASSRDRTDEKMFVRFVFCHEKHLKVPNLHPEFLMNEEEFKDILSNLTCENAWATQGHLNHYNDDLVLMLGCAGRKPLLENGAPLTVFRDGRDSLGHGVGPRVSLLSKCASIQVKNDAIQLCRTV